MNQRNPAAKRKRRSSLFRHSGGNPCYRDKLKAQVAQYLQCIEKRQDESFFSPKAQPQVLLSDDKKNFLASLPNVDSYVEVMTRFLNQHNALCQEKENIRVVLQEKHKELI